MQDVSSPRTAGAGTITVSNPSAARILLDPDELHFFEPFLNRESTVKAAAALLGCRPNSLLARVRKMQHCGLLEVAREVPRAGRAIKVYRSVAAVYFVPLSGWHYDDHAVWARSRARLVEAGLRYGHAQDEALRGHRIYRDERGVVSHQLAVDAGTNHDPLGPGSPALYTASNDAVYLDFADAKRLQQELHDLMERYKVIGGSQRYLLWLNCVPLPEQITSD